MATWKELAFAANVATLSDDDPAAVGTSSSEGTGDTASRDDHVHVLGAGSINAENLFGAGVVTATALQDDCVNAAQLAAFSAAINFNGNQASNLIVHQAASSPAPVVGKIYQKTGDKTLWICTASS